MSLFETTRTLAAGESQDFNGPWDWVQIKSVEISDIIALAFNRGQSDATGEATVRTNYRYHHNRAKNITFKNTGAVNCTITFQCGTGDFYAPANDITVTASIASAQSIFADLRAVASGGADRYRVVALGTNNAAVIKATAGKVLTLYAINTNAAKRYVKLYNVAVAPNVGVDIPALTVELPVTGAVNVDLGAAGLNMGTGIGIAIVTGVADADNTAVTAGDVIVTIGYK